MTGRATATDLLADPRTLDLEDGVLAVRLAQQDHSTLNILIALQKVAIAANDAVWRRAA